MGFVCPQMRHGERKKGETFYGGEREVLGGDLPQVERTESLGQSRGGGSSGGGGGEKASSIKWERGGIPADSFARGVGGGKGKGIFWYVHQFCDWKGPIRKIGGGRVEEG